MAIVAALNQVQWHLGEDDTWPSWRVGILLDEPPENLLKKPWAVPYFLPKRLVEAVIARAQRLETAGRSHQSLMFLGKALAADPDIQKLFDREIAP